jgi:hypothetical protein
MSFHLEGPWLSTTGKKRGKKKFRNAEQARKARELDASWKNLLSKYNVTPVKKPKPKVEILSVAKPFIRETQKIPSLPFTGGPCPKVESQVYTGTKVKGIGTMHKSNAVPIFSDDEARDIAKMRR